MSHSLGIPANTVSAQDVRARIAQIMLGDPDEAAIGKIRLKRHQSSAVSRIELAFAEFGGALLCDEVGMGKTYVAAAIARSYPRVIVVAPASLVGMWNRALSITGASAKVVSFEKLSRQALDVRDGRDKANLDSPLSAKARGDDLLIIDEAHHVRNRTTRRYPRVQRLARTARVLLLSATPIHNRRDDLLALLALFLGARAKALTAGELSRCVIRRQHQHVDPGARIPRVLPVSELQLSDRPEITRALLDLPQAIPVRDGGLAKVLIARGLIHQWASSEAALHEAVAKRIARATALIASLNAGVYPTEKELRTWTFEDGSLQLAFAELLASPCADTVALRECVTQHRRALENLPLDQQDSMAHRHVTLAGDLRNTMDAERARLLIGILESHPKEKIVAFAQYAPTVTMLFQKLKQRGRVAALTARGGRVAAGTLTRDEVLARFAPEATGVAPPALAEELDLLLTTDLLSEGINLQDTGVVVHLDLPWTAARMEQRVGRVARIGSKRSTVQPYLIRPPKSAADVLEGDVIIKRKWDVTQRAVGSGMAPPIFTSLPAREASPPESAEVLRMTLEGWRRSHSTISESVKGCARSEHRGFLAVVLADEQTQLAVNIDGRISTELETQIEACRNAGGSDSPATSEDYSAALTELECWLENEMASALAGTNASGVRRKHLLNQIDRAIERAPPHARAHRLALAADARRVVAAHHSGAVEAELDSLSASDLSSEDWLAAVGGLVTPTPPRPTSENHSSLLAILLLRRDESRP